MNAGKILITGATGDTGGYAIEQLLQRGREVRALAHAKDERSEKLRQREVEVVHGDLLDFGQVRAALDGVRGAYFVFPLRPGIIQATAYFAQAAREAGVEAIVNMSQISAREDSKSHAARDHWVAERVFDWSGIAVTHLRPTYFAESLLYYTQMVNGTLYSWLGTGKHAPVAAEDLAASSWASWRTQRRTAARSIRCSDRRSARPPRSRRSWPACWARTSATSRSASRNCCR